MIAAGRYPELRQHFVRDCNFGLSPVPFRRRITPPCAKTGQRQSHAIFRWTGPVILNRLVGDGIPHPTGSPQNDVVRGRVVEEFTRLGYQPSVQEGFACDDYGDCATVKNVLARLEGAEPGPAVLVAAHYDSVAAGPGAFDDGAGAPRCWKSPAPSSRCRSLDIRSFF